MKSPSKSVLFGGLFDRKDEAGPVAVRFEMKIIRKADTVMIKKDDNVTIAHDLESAACIICHSAGLAYVNALRDDDNYWAARCNTCGHIQVTPLPTVEEDEKYYQNNEIYRKLIQKSAMDDTALMYKMEPWADAQVKIVTELVPRDKSLLEMGGGYGFFVEKIRAAGYACTGIELSDEKCLMAKQRAGIDLINANILDESFCMAEKFDVVCLFGVLEHIADPVGLLKQVRKFLVDGGKLILTVPNVDQWLNQYSGGYYNHHFFRGHLHYFSKDTLTNVIQLAKYFNIRIFGKQHYSVENAIHWMRNNTPVLSNLQFEVPEALGAINQVFKKQLEEQLASDILVGVGTNICCMAE